MTDPGLADGVGGTGGVTKNQGDDAQRGGLTGRRSVARSLPRI